MNNELIGRCGFFCGSCPTYISGQCSGCMKEHNTSDCYTRDCTIKKKLNYCGECSQFPCDVILTKPHTTVLDKDWLRWKKESNTNR
ncbi:MAG: DUF3795 domain-containing protein [Lachnospiraceae bacterium]|nr:DUF3795 domain-containing protein [Lachnospiraceae bacterium]